MVGALFCCYCCCWLQLMLAKHFLPLECGLRELPTVHNNEKCSLPILSLFVLTAVKLALPVFGFCVLVGGVT